MVLNKFYNFDCTFLNSLDLNMPSSKDVTESKDGHRKYDVEIEVKAGNCYSKVSCSL